MVSLLLSNQINNNKDDSNNNNNSNNHDNNRSNVRFQHLAFDISLSSSSHRTTYRQSLSSSAPGTQSRHTQRTEAPDVYYFPGNITLQSSEHFPLYPRSSLIFEYLGVMEAAIWADSMTFLITSKPFARLRGRQDTADRSRMSLPGVLTKIYRLDCQQSA